MPGLKGLGPKTLIKEFPGLVKDSLFELNDIHKICTEKLQTKKIFAQILYDWNKVKTNYELMNLLEPRLGDYEIVHILDKIKEVRGKPICEDCRKQRRNKNVR